jgi:hypothetical protein
MSDLINNGESGLSVRTKLNQVVVDVDQIFVDVDGIQTSLDNKSAIGHTHNINEVDQLRSELDDHFDMISANKDTIQMIDEKVGILEDRVDVIEPQITNLSGRVANLEFAPEIDLTPIENRLDILEETDGDIYILFEASGTFEFFAPYPMKITSIEKNSPQATITITADFSSYTLGNTINAFDNIRVSSTSSAYVVLKTEKII